MGFCYNSFGIRSRENMQGVDLPPSGCSHVCSKLIDTVVHVSE